MVRRRHLERLAANCIDRHLKTAARDQTANYLGKTRQPDGRYRTYHLYAYGCMRMCRNSPIVSERGGRRKWRPRRDLSAA